MGARYKVSGQIQGVGSAEGSQEQEALNPRSICHEEASLSPASTQIVGR